MNKVFIGALAVIILILLSLFGCEKHKNGKLEKELAKAQNQPAPAPKVERIETVKDSFIKVPVYVPQIKYRDTGSTKYVGQPYAVPGPIRYIDSSAKGFTAYADSLPIPMDGGHLMLYDTLAGNTIVSRRADWHRKQQIITEKETVQAEARRRLLLGVGGGFMPHDSTVFVGIKLMYQNRRGVGYELGAKANPAGHLLYEGGIVLPISLRKK